MTDEPTPQPPHLPPAPHLKNPNEGFEPLEAADGAEGMTLAKTGNYDLLLLDLSLNLRALISQRLLRTIDGEGRRAAIEILLNTPLMSDLILKGEVHEMKDLMKKSNEAGMKTFDQALFDLVEDDAISIDEAMRNADSVNDLRLRIKLESKHGRDPELNSYAELAVEEHDDDNNGGGMMRY